jgi:hypothetical protein
MESEAVSIDNSESLKQSSVDIAGLSSIDDDYLISASTIERTFQGVIVAANIPADRAELVLRWISSERAPGQGEEPASHSGRTVSSWLTAATGFSGQEDLHQVVNLTIGIAYMRERGRKPVESTTEAASLKFVWGLVRSALSSSHTLFKPSRGAQGFFFVPLCSLVTDGNIDELWRLHVWLPDGRRANPNFTVHAHPTFSQGWILAGEGTNQTWTVEPADDAATATHAEFRVTWAAAAGGDADGDSNKSSRAYKPHTKSSTAVNCKVYVKVAHAGTEVHRRDASYAIPTEVYHSSEVAPDAAHATLFFFDAGRGTMPDASLLGPKDLESDTSFRDPAGVTAAALVRMVEAMRSWEVLAEQGEELEQAASSFQQALAVCMRK